MSQFLTFDERNQFSFTCPIFDAETKMAVCLKVRELKWAGKGSEKRLGCQAAMTCGKCPATTITDHIIHRSWGGTGTPDEYGSLTPVTGRLRANILERIQTTIVREDVMSNLQVPEAERSLIRSSNERIAKQLSSAPQGEGRTAPREYVASGKKRAVRATSHDPAIVKLPPVAANDSSLSSAARTGDLSAAING